MAPVNRRAFLTLAGLGAIGPADLARGAARFRGSVVVVGAGAAGLAAGRHLHDLGIPFTILEASAAIGGRMKIDTDFADFPIPLGAEWLHGTPAIFEEIAGQGASVPTFEYSGKEVVVRIKDGAASQSELGKVPHRKFANSSWFEFFQRYVAPPIAGKVRLHQTVDRIDYANDRVTVSTKQGGVFQADRVLVTVPLPILQGGELHFHPELPAAKRTALGSAQAWPGLKLFIEVSKAFYPNFVWLARSRAGGERLFYDAAYGQKTDRVILGFLTVGEAARPYLGGGALDRVMAELDDLFDGQASRFYRKHLVQDWSAEPHIRCAYLRDEENPDTIATLFQPLEHKVFFAGEAYTPGGNWGSVDVAALAARRAVEAMIRPAWRDLALEPK